MRCQEILDDLVDTCQRILGGSLTGIYLHGSLAMGCFNPHKSDIDVIVIVEDSIADEQKLSLLENIAELDARAPAKGLEISFVNKEYCDPFIYPTPFEMHFSCMHRQRALENPREFISQMKGEDRDLAAHFTIIKEYGVKLSGKEIPEVFGAVPADCYLDSLWHDIKNAAADILDQPVYNILNLCRISAYLREGTILSKERGGEWGLENLEKKYRSLILQALQCYRSDRGMQAEEEAGKQFAETLLKEIESGIKKQLTN